MTPAASPTRPPRVIAVCDKPYKLMYFTITFRSFTPQPGGLEFHPGQDYYFISTSSKEDLHRRIGGRCSSHHMKVVFKVCCDPSAQTPRDQANNHIPNNGPASTRGTSTTSSTTSTKPSTISTTPKTSSTTTSTSTTHVTTTHATTPHKTSMGHDKNPDPHHNTKTTTKKTDTHQPDRSENEVVKNEELTLSSSPRVSTSTSSLLLLVALVLPLLITQLLSFPGGASYSSHCRRRTPLTCSSTTSTSSTFSAVTHITHS
ncbi:hypothetical protein Pcinc_016111 [Petrolisthes cinctipes]|uniref:Ephrin RBD domain-containing protein n=1 Tax=Petrolisthes cinctipes TaxID=88211 RepID=A0AAE1KPT8_PETCI|nr:hypothetical protein Pcinc_016111 [Petrolisthes cinctipes]